MENKGVGPAIVKSVKVNLATGSFREDQLDELFKSLLTTSLLYNHTGVQGRVMKSGELVKMVEITNLREAIRLDSALKSNKASISICYCSIFDECWRIQNSKVVTCDDCEEE